jgi:MarR family
MSENMAPGWTFLTNHGQVLVCIARDPGVRLRDIGERVRITERAAHRIVAELADAGYITRHRNGRRNQYTINARLPLPDTIAREQNVGQLLEILTVTPAATDPSIPREPTGDRRARVVDTNAAVVRGGFA